MFSIGKIFTLILILLTIWYVFKIFGKKKKSNKHADPKKLDAYKCPSCGVWTFEKNCTNQNCSSNK